MSVVLSKDISRVMISLDASRHYEDVIRVQVDG